MGLDIRLIGPPVVEVDGVALDVDTRKAIAVLAYLAIEPGPHPRDRFVDLLWSDSGLDRGRSSLRRTLSALRAGLGGRWVEADRAFIALDRSDIRIDVEEVDRLLAPHDRHVGEVCATCIDDLTAAVALHRGPILDGFTIRGAPEFELWVSTQSEINNHRLDSALSRLAAAHSTGGDYDTAAAATERRIRIDPLREDAYRDLMRYLAWSGDRSGAVDVYRRAVGVLDTELGVAPLDETTGLYQAILEEDLPRAPAPPRRATESVAPAAIPFVGRDHELAAAVTALGAEGSTVVIEGIPGSGVSRFIQEVIARLRAQATPLVALATDSERANPYGVINQALFDLVASDDAGAAIRRLPASVLSEAARIFPDLGTPPSESSPTRFMDALARVVAAIPNPLLVVDDMDQADPASLAVIAFLANRAQRIGIRILVGVEMDPTATRQDPLEDIVRGAFIVSLDPFDRDRVVEFAAATSLDTDADTLLEETGGLPLFLVEATLTGIDPDSTPTRRVIARLASLPGAARQVYEAIAVLGRSSDAGTLAAVAGRSPDEIDEAIDLLVSTGLAVEEASGAVRVAHGLMATAARDRLTAARRRLLNRRAAAALESRGDEPGRIAHHHALAGDDTAAAEWHFRAGEAAAAAFAYNEALEHLGAALAAGHPDRAMIHRRMGATAVLAGNYDRAVDAYEAALAAGDQEPAQVEHQLGEIMRRLGRWDLAAAHYERASRADATPELAAVIAADRAYVEHRRTGRGADEMAADALAKAAESGSERALARAHNVAGLLATTDEERRRHFETALVAAHHPEERIAVLNNLAAASEGDVAVDLANTGLELATSLGDRHLMAALGNTLADALHASGDTSAAQSALAGAVALFAEVSAAGTEPWNPEVWFLSEW